MFITYEKECADIARRIGLQDLKILVMPLIKRARIAMDKGDECLNSIPVDIWDALAGRVRTNDESELLSWGRPWTRHNASDLTLTDRISVLKHVAREMAEKEGKCASGT